VNDLNKLQALAKAAREKAETETAEQAERSKSIQIQKDALFAAMVARLNLFKESLKSDVPAYISANSSEISVSISEFHRYISKPYRKFKISVAHTGYDFFNEIPVNGEGKPEDRNAHYCLTEESVINLLTKGAAQFVNRDRTTSNWSPPAWYETIGNILGWLGFVGTWVALLSGGLWGVLLGWIPALCALFFLRTLWGIFLVFGVIGLFNQ
jgi:hypothetical protein